MQIKQLLNSLDDINIPTALADKAVTALVNDSRNIVSGCVFLAEQGLSSHALDYLTLEQCELVAAIVYQPNYDLTQFESAGFGDKFIAIPKLNQKVSLIGRDYYQPVFAQSLIGVTGTNGKTSITHFVAQLADYGVIGTMGYGDANNLIELSHTTPDALSVQRLLSELSGQFAGIAMEVSSHALSLYRVAAVNYEIAVFTNLSQDHLDFHSDMDEYFVAKSKLFTMPSVKVAVINTDDDYGYQLAQQCAKNSLRVLAYGQQQERAGSFNESIVLENIRLSQQGLVVDLNFDLAGYQAQKTLSAPIWGAFNAANLVAAMLTQFAQGVSVDVLLNKAPTVMGVKGRIEPIDLGDCRTAIIDYAHTPDALVNTLKSLRQQVSGRIYTVFGCGGDRDKVKRPLMAEAVNLYSDFGIVTDDNPRTENSADIIADILTGDIESIRFQTIASRREAIRFGLSRLSENDVLLIAGKGHEDYQIIGTEKKPFSDHAVVQEWCNENA